jgi:hypothetical protein
MKKVFLLAAFLASAAQAADPRTYTVAMTMTTPNSTSSPH